MEIGARFMKSIRLFLIFNTHWGWLNIKRDVCSSLRARRSSVTIKQRQETFSTDSYWEYFSESSVDCWFHLQAASIFHGIRRQIEFTECLCVKCAAGSNISKRRPAIKNHHRSAAATTEAMCSVLFGGNYNDQRRIFLLSNYRQSTNVGLFCKWVAVSLY